MDGEQLREVQAPLKTRYRETPRADAALITLHADGVLGSEDVTCSVQTGRALVEAGLHEATGATARSFAWFGRHVLQALVGAVGVTLRSVATIVASRDRHGGAEGDLDFRGTLGVAS